MSANRFFLSPSEWGSDGTLELQGDEARHCAEVLRGKPGDKITIFDGLGREAHGEILEVGSSSVTTKVLVTDKKEASGVRLGLAQAVPKGKSMDLIIQKATELGVGIIIPVLSERTVVKLDAKDAAKKKAKWERVALEACKQCGRNWVPEIADPTTVEALVTDSKDWDLRLVGSLQPDARRLKEILAEHEDMNGSRPSSALVLVGPEGDYTPAELSLAKGEGYLPLGLGPIVLRSETAAMHCLSILGHELM